MKEITAVKINPTDFAPFGTYCSMTEPEGYPLQGEIHKFYPDRISGTCRGSMGFSPTINQNFYPRFSVKRF